jgi:hypothetical protein
MIAARTASALVVAGCLAGALLADAERTAAADRLAWTEVKWPFLIDQWGLGRAFQCRAPACGSDVVLYLRAKVGFCNCTTGVAEDDEIDRVGDLELIGARARPHELGKPVAVGWMKGRSRTFLVDGANQPRRFAVTVALANKCDAIVATVVATQPIQTDTERAAMAFLASEPVLGWAKANTGL